MALSDDYLWEQAVQATIGGDIHIIKFARAIEDEVRKQDTELIRQLVEALENHDGNYKLSKSAGAAVNAAITAGRARLEGKP